jgi:hypothetical protein
VRFLSCLEQGLLGEVAAIIVKHAFIVLGLMACRILGVVAGAKMLVHGMVPASSSHCGKHVLIILILTSLCLYSSDKILKIDVLIASHVLVLVVLKIYQIVLLILQLLFSVWREQIEICSGFSFAGRNAA